MLVEAQLCLTPLQPCGLKLTKLLCPWNFPGKKTGVDCHFLLQEIFPGTKPVNLVSPTLAGRLVITEPPGKPGGPDSKEPGCKAEVGKIPWRRGWLPTPVFLPGELHGQRSRRAAVHGVTESHTQLKRMAHTPGKP